MEHTAAGNKGGLYEEWLYYLKDALGSVMALVDLDSGNVVERYAYDPYGRTEVLVRFLVEYPGGPMAPAGAYFYHDQDFDGDVDARDAADLQWCLGSDAARCASVSSFILPPWSASDTLSMTATATGR